MNKDEYRQNNEEIKRVEDNLHDIINWLNLGIVLPLETINEWLKQGDYEKISVMLPNLILQSRNILDEITNIQSNFFEDKIKKSSGVSIALQEIANNWMARTGLQDNTITLDCFETNELPEITKESLAAIANEAVSNAIKHSGIMSRSGIEINILFVTEKKLSILEIQDNGNGTSKIDEGYGVRKIKRILSDLDKVGIKSTCSFKTSPGRGFKIRIEIRD